MYRLAAYLGHNSSLTIYTKNEIVEVLEFERLVGYKNAGCWFRGTNNPQQLLEFSLNYIIEKYNVEKFEKLIINVKDHTMLRKGYTDCLSDTDLLNLFNAETLEINKYHQYSHIAGGFYLSDFEEAIGISFDGGGCDGNFSIFNLSKTDGIEEIAKIGGYTLGMKLAEFGQYTKSIKKEEDFFGPGSLVYPGKLMGLSSYGTVNEEWLPHFLEFFSEAYPYPDMNQGYKNLQKKCEFPDEYDGELEANIVATAQRAFEQIFDKLTKKYYDQHENLVLGGGCALNIINNERLSHTKNVFISPNPNDSGLSLGFALDDIKPKTPQKNIVYLGPDVWDKYALAEYAFNRNPVRLNYREICEKLLNGKIIGVVRGRSELGPRALGNRSILCYAGHPNMKEILNKKVKNRESFRPFAPVCRKEDAGKWFMSNMADHKWMSFCPTVLEQYRDKLKSITHVDNTARLQTVDRGENEFLFFLLSMLNDEYTDTAVLLNTSFNIAGKPILNSYKDAFWMLDNTELDGLIIDDYYFEK